MVQFILRDKKGTSLSCRLRSPSRRKYIYFYYTFIYITGVDMRKGEDMNGVSY